MPSLYGMLKGGTSGPYLFDKYSGASVGYSFRQLKSTATKSVRIRRVSDNAEQDFGFVGGYVDSTAITNYISTGGGFGYITKWYDQSGNGNDAVQATNANQPLVGISGANISANFNGTTNFFSITTPITQSSGATALVLSQKTSLTNQMFGFESPSANYMQYDNNGSINFSLFNGTYSHTLNTDSSSWSNNTDKRVWGAIISTTGSTLNFGTVIQDDGGNANVHSAGSNTGTGSYAYIGKSGGAFYTNGNFFEAVLWNSYNANWGNILGNITTYYGLP